MDCRYYIYHDEALRMDILSGNIYERCTSGKQNSDPVYGEK